MDPKIIAARNHVAQTRLRDNARAIAELYGSSDVFPQVPAIAQKVKGHKREVQTLRQHEAIADVLGVTRRVLEAIGTDLVAEAAAIVALELIAESAADLEAQYEAEASATAEPEPQADAPVVDTGIEDLQTYRVVEAFEIGDEDAVMRFEVGEEIQIDPIQFVDLIAEGKIVAVAIDPNPSQPEPDAITQAEIADNPAAALEPEPTAEPEPQADAPVVDEQEKPAEGKKKRK